MVAAAVSSHTNSSLQPPHRISGCLQRRRPPLGADCFNAPLHERCWQSCGPLRRLVPLPVRRCQSAARCPGQPLLGQRCALKPVLQGAASEHNRGSKGGHLARSVTLNLTTADTDCSAGPDWRLPCRNMSHPKSTSHTCNQKPYLDPASCPQGSWPEVQQRATLQAFNRLHRGPPRPHHAGRALGQHFFRGSHSTPVHACLPSQQASCCHCCSHAQQAPPPPRAFAAVSHQVCCGQLARSPKP